MIDSGNDYVCVIDSDSDIDEIVLPTSGITDPQHASSVADLPEDQSRQLEEVEMSTMLEDVDSVTLALRTSYPDMSIDPNVVFEQLEILGTCKNRVAKVVQLLIDLHAPYVSRPSVRGPDQVPSLTTAANNAMTADTNTNDQNMPQPNNLELREPAIETSHLKPEKEVYNSLLNDVQKIIEIFPYVNAEEVYAYLEARREENDRVQNVIEELIHRNPPNSEEYSFQVESYLDVDHISIPKKRLKLTPPSSNVISSTNTFSAALIDSPPSDRQSYFVNVEPAVEEVTVLTEDTPEPCSSRPSHPVADETLSNLKMTVGESSTMDTIDRSNGDNADNVVLIENSLTSDTSVDAQVMDQFQVLKDTFPDADPDHLFTLVNEFGKDEMRLQQHVTEMLENKVYPKLKDRLEKERKQALKEKFSTNIFTPEEVLEWFDDPLTLFYDTNKPVSRNYEIHSTNQLRNDFPRLTLTSIQAAIVKHNHHYTPALRELQARQAEECSSAKYRRRKARPLLCMPEEPDELFYKELAFTKIEDELRAFLKKKHEDHEHRFNEAKNNGKLLTCNCCYDDENLHEDMIECSNGHLFCKECVRRGAEVAIGQGRTALHCMSADCATSFPLQSLQMVLKPSVFSNLLRKIQEAEISEAGIPDLVQCPFCSFAAIMPNPEDKVFRCLNPECFKETCRFCKEPNHVPLRCNEVEKADEVKMRTYIEDKMTEALLRQCWKCQRRFMKSEGCNKMTCVCGASMCYVCRQPIKDYTHFQNGKCAQNSNTEIMHQNEVITGGEKAKKEYLEQHPELENVTLKHDPMKDLPNVIPVNGQGVHDQHHHHRHHHHHYHQVFEPLQPPPRRDPVVIRRVPTKRVTLTATSGAHFITNAGVHIFANPGTMVHNGTVHAYNVPANAPQCTVNVSTAHNPNVVQNSASANIPVTSAHSANLQNVRPIHGSIAGSHNHAPGVYVFERRNFLPNSGNQNWVQIDVRNQFVEKPSQPPAAVLPRTTPLKSYTITVDATAKNGNVQPPPPPIIRAAKFQLPGVSVPAVYTTATKMSSTSSVVTVRIPGPQPYTNVPLADGTFKISTPLEPQKRMPSLTASSVILKPAQASQVTEVGVLRVAPMSTSNASSLLTVPLTTAMNGIEKPGSGIEGNAGNGVDALKCRPGTSNSDQTLHGRSEWAGQCSQLKASTSVEVPEVNGGINTFYSDALEPNASNACPSEDGSKDILGLLDEEINHIDWDALYASVGANYVVTTTTNSQK